MQKDGDITKDHFDDEKKITAQELALECPLEHH